MILDDLNAFYEMKAGDPQGNFPQRGWSVARVGWELHLDEAGGVVGLVPLADDTKMKVPEQETRTSGIKPFFLCDKAAYFFGLDEKRGVKMRDESAQLHRRILEGVDDDAARAVLLFFEREDTLSGVASEYADELRKGRLIVFFYEPDGRYVHEGQAVAAAWNRSLADDEPVEEIQCAVTGEKRAPAKLFPQTRGIPGAQSSGAGLVGFNQESFCSYGKTQSDQALNAWVSQEAASNIGRALDYLADRNNGHCVDIGDSRILFWTESESKESLDAISLMFDSDALTNRAKEDAKALALVRRRLEDIRRGRGIVSDEADTKFFILGLAPNMSRLSVRFFEVGTLGALGRRFARYLDDISMTDGNGAILAPRSIGSYVYQTAAFGKRENVPETLLCSTIRAMIRGTAFPPALFEQLIMRTRIDKGCSGSGERKYDAMLLRAPMLKACLMRKARQRNDQSTERGLTMSLNEENENIGYLLGRLFAVLEKAQFDAIPGINATIRDRYIGSASATPARVFPQLMKNAQFHISKAEYGNVSDRRIQDIVARIESVNGFPPTLSYDDQGHFFIGYYQQKAALYAGKGAETSTDQESMAQEQE